MEIVIFAVLLLLIGAIGLVYRVAAALQVKK